MRTDRVQRVSQRIKVFCFFFSKKKYFLPCYTDDHILETAINGSANVIATFNLRHLAKSAAKFNISAARPVAILNKLRFENTASTGEQ